MRHNSLTALALFTCAITLAISALTPVNASRTMAPPEVNAIASCDFRTVATELVDSPRYAEDREEFRKSLETPEIVSMRERVERLNDRMRAAIEAENREEYEAVYAEWDQLTDELWPREGEIEAKVQERIARDTAEAYNEILRVARELADDLGYDAVVQTSADPLLDEEDDNADEEEEDFNPYGFYSGYSNDDSAPEGVHDRFAKRMIPVLPEGTDITDDVRYELDLD